MGMAIWVETTGGESHALWARSGKLDIRNSLLVTHGDAAAGLYVSSATSGENSQVLLDNVLMTTTVGPAIKTDGASLELVIQNDSQLTGGNGVLLENRAGDLSDPRYKRDVSLAADNHVMLRGDIRAETENYVAITLSNASQLDGAISDIDIMQLDNHSRWEVTGSSDFGQLHSDGMVSFRPEAANFKTLSLTSLTGNGVFAMNTDIASLRGDMIAVSGTVSGNHLIAINNTGREPGRSEEYLTVVTTGGGDGQFALKNGSVDIGTYQYTLQQYGNDWVLTQKFTDPGEGDNPGEGGEDPKPTPTTLSALGLFNATPTAWYGELTTLRTRLGDVRMGNQEGGAWARMLGNQYNVNDRAGVDYRQHQTGISVGVDRAHVVSAGKVLTGIFSGVSQSELNFNHGSSGNIDSFFIGGYGTWLLQSDWFVDGVIKANNFNSHADVRMTDGTKAKGGYSVPALGVSLEIGRQLSLTDGWFVEPSAQLSSVWVKGQSYTFSNELHADSGSVTSHKAKLNGVLGKTQTLKNGIMLQPWLRAALNQEFSNSNAVSINGNHFNNDLSGTDWEFGGGLSARITDNWQLYADARYIKGEKITSPWGANLGMHFSW
jgi:outer membrane autotransporter protein